MLYKKLFVKALRKAGLYDKLPAGVLKKRVFGTQRLPPFKLQGRHPAGIIGIYGPGCGDEIIQSPFTRDRLYMHTGQQRFSMPARVSMLTIRSEHTPTG